MKRIHYLLEGIAYEKFEKVYVFSFDEIKVKFAFPNNKLKVIFFFTGQYAKQIKIFRNLFKIKLL